MRHIINEIIEGLTFFEVPQTTMRKIIRSRLCKIWRKKYWDRVAAISMSLAGVL